MTLSQTRKKKKSLYSECFVFLYVHQNWAQSQKRVSSPLELWVLCGCWELNLGSSVWTARSLKGIAISSNPRGYLSKLGTTIDTLVVKFMQRKIGIGWPTDRAEPGGLRTVYLGYSR